MELTRDNFRAIIFEQLLPWRGLSQKECIDELKLIYGDEAPSQDSIYRWYIEWYTTICLQQVFVEIRKTNRRRRITLHHDNASSHASAQTSEFLSTNKIELMGHPPYSPDLAPNDFFLFLTIKKKLRGQRFATPEDAVDAFKTHVLKILHSDWEKCFSDWFKRMQ
ncbi:hypothetical protein HA402_011960, partial [Bradysia odoriphaga]